MAAAATATPTLYFYFAKKKTRMSTRRETATMWLIWAVVVCVSLLVYCSLSRRRTTVDHRQASQIEQYRSFLRIPPGQLLRIHDNSHTLSVYAANMLQQAMQHTSLVHFLQWSEVPGWGGGEHASPKSPPPAPAMFDIVLAYYKVNPVEWLLELSEQLPESIFPSQVRIFVYAKATDPEDPPFDANKIAAMFPETWRERLIIIPLQNVGRCDHTYVYHIVKQVYLNPTAPYLMFLKDRTHRDISLDWLVQRFRNPPNTFSGVAGGILNSWEGGADFRHAHPYYTLHDQNQNRDTFLTAPEFLQPLHAWMQAILQDPEFPKDGYAAPQYKGIFMVPSEQVKRISRDVWIRAGISLCYGRNIETGHYMERVWATLLGGSPRFTPP